MEEKRMIQQTTLGGRFTFPATSLTVNRMGYGAMQLAGREGNKLVWGPPKDVDGAIAVLREAVARGVNHIDTSDFYGPHVTNQIIRKALSPYPNDLVIVTKVSVRRGEDGSWIPAFSREELTAAVHDNLRNLGLDVLDVVNLRAMFDVHGPAEGSIEAPITALAGLQQKGLIRHIGLSNVTPAQIWKPNGSPPSSACRTSTTSRNAPTMRSSPILPGMASLTYRSFRWAGSPRCSRLRYPTPPCVSVSHPCRLRSLGFSSGRPTFW
jgi:aryl-alcohol dehydrogenase-like predicted oxidoreductase